jgi:alkanesulfonate monooxygenase SsuD/methylene tetrahydromethanopterin reductase-like flavin-dependent oxidoreductase (luciferase family)
MGYEAEAKRCQDLYLEGRKDEAAAAIPTKLVEEIALIGPPEKIRHDLEAWRDSIVTTILVSGPPELLRQAAELVLG